jgi:hypothetical protein
MVVNISSNAQGENNLKRLNDSLRFELKNTGIDTVKAAIMIQLAENLLYSNPDSAMYFGEKALQIAERENLIQVQLGTIGFIGNTRCTNSCSWNWPNYRQYGEDILPDRQL